LIFFRYLTSSVLRYQIVVVMILLLVFVTNKFARFLAAAATGELPGDVVISFLLFYLPYLISVLLPLSLFIGILLALGRFYAEQELVSMQFSGVGLLKVIKYLMPTAVFLSLVTGWFSMHLAPVGFLNEFKLKQELKARSDIYQLEPGQFERLGPVMVFASKDTNGELGPVFVAEESTIEQGGHAVMFARQAAKRHPADWQETEYMALSNGVRYESFESEQRFSITEYDEYGLMIRSKNVEPKRQKLESLPIAELWGVDDPEYQAELQWRLALPVQTLLAAILAVFVAKVAPRQGKYAKLLPGISMYLLYFALLTTARNQVEDGALPPMPGLWSIHAISATIIFIYILRQTSGYPFRKRKVLVS